MSSIPVQCAGGSYEVVVDPGGLHSLGARALEVARGRRVLLVADSAVADTHAIRAASGLEAAGFRVQTCSIVCDEHRKSMATVESLYQAALGAGLGRSDLVVSVGGGLVGDVAGFLAATYLRGIDFINVPTTLLAMVDASVGGKTGVNLPLPDDDGVPRLGKNLAGAFWPPRLVLADPELLESLPDRELRCGLAECVKHGVIASQDLLDGIDHRLDVIRAADPAATAWLVDQAVRIKARVVEEDEHEHGRRAVLNLGHTFGHAIEPIDSLDLLHGEAVSVGLVAAIALSRAIGQLEGDWADGFVRRLERIGLPVQLPQAVPVAELLLRMGFDKKAHGGSHTLIVPHCPGRVSIVPDVPEEAIVAAWRAVGAD